MELAELETWLLKNGAHFPHCTLKGFENGNRGCVAKSNIAPKTPIISIPQCCIITDLMGKTKTDWGLEVFSKRNTDGMFSNSAIIAVVLYILFTQNDKDHFFRAYYDCLPKSYDDFPVFWSEEDLERRLQGSELIGEVRARRKVMYDDYSMLCRLLGESFSKPVSFHEFLKIRTAVGSRNFAIFIDNQKRTAMVPFADMLNHLRPRQTTWMFDQASNNFVISSVAGLDRGVEVMDSYGKKDNARFLLYYGFTIEVNREENGFCPNELLLKVKMEANENVINIALLEVGDENNTSSSDEDGDEVEGEEEEEETQGNYNDNGKNNNNNNNGDEDDSRKTRLMMLHYLGGEYYAKQGTVIKTFKLSMNREDPKTMDVLKFFRIYVCEDDALVATISKRSIISLENEVKALRCVARLLQAKLSGYARSYEENLKRIAVLKKKKNEFIECNATVAIVGEQEICKFWIKTYEVVESIVEDAKKKYFYLKDITEYHSFIIKKLLSLPKQTDEELDRHKYVSWLANCLIMMEQQ